MLRKNPIKTDIDQSTLFAIELVLTEIETVGNQDVKSFNRLL